MAASLPATDGNFTGDKSFLFLSIFCEFFLVFSGQPGWTDLHFICSVSCRFRVVRLDGSPFFYEVFPVFSGQLGLTDADEHRIVYSEERRGVSVVVQRGLFLHKQPKIYRGSDQFRCGNTARTAASKAS